MNALLSLSSALAVSVCITACGSSHGASSGVPAALPYDDTPRQRTFTFSDAEAHAPDTERMARLERRLYPALILPLKPAVDGDAADVERGLGIADVLARVLSLESRDAALDSDTPLLAGEWLMGINTFFGASDLFATSDERARWIMSSDATRLPSKVARSRYRWVIGGNLLPAVAGAPRGVRLWLMDRMAGQVWSGTTTLDLPRLQRPRFLLVELLTDAGQAPPEVERGDMLWAEELDDDALRLVGHTAIEAAWGDAQRTEQANAALVKAAPWSWVAWITVASNGVHDDCSGARRDALNRAFSINPRGDFLAQSTALGCQLGDLIDNLGPLGFEGMQRSGAVNCSVAGKAIAMIGGGREVPGSGFLAGLGGFYRGGSCADGGARDLAEIADRATDPFVQGGLYIDAGVAALGDGALGDAARLFERAEEVLAGLAAAPTCLPKLYVAEAELHLAGLRLQAGRLDEAAEHARAALPIAEQCADPRLSGRVHNLLGLVAQSAAHYQEALAELGLALASFEDLGDEMNVAVAKTNIGWTRVLLGQPELGLPELQEALRLKRRVRSDGGVAVALENLGVTYMTLGEFAQAEPYLIEARALTQDRASQAAIATNLARIRAGQGKTDEALALLQEARELAERIHARVLSAQVEQTEASIEVERGNALRALDAFNAALVIRREVGDRSGEALTLASLMVVARKLDKPALAIMYGKLAVQAIQEVKAAAREVDPQAERAFVAKRETIYRQLAALLLKSGRLIEAERVLALLKTDEAEAWTRSAADGRATIALTPAERELEQAYKSIADDVLALGREYGALASKDPLTSEEAARLTKLRGQMEAVNAKFSAFLASLADQPIASQRIDELREDAGMSADLAEMPGTVVVYTLVADGNYHAIVVSADTQVAESVKLPADIDSLVLELREALQDPRSDPRPMAKELYDIVVAPIAAHLDGAKAKTVLWSLDHALRYVPIAALWDGKRYVAERWPTAVITLASRARLKDAPQASWRVLAAGVSKATDGFSALPAVVDELARIVDDGQTRGALPGEAMLDEAFEREAFIDRLRKKWPVVHIASHFSFQPGDKDSSFLVLGKGRLTVTDLERIPSLFQGVDLLTLSACNTATADAGPVTGREVEGFAALAQIRGARAVLASLWPVADGSTSVLMQRFYALHQSGLSKVEALRQAQLELLHGKVTAQSSGVRGPRPLGAPAEPAAADWRHPYYWAPFILMGNPR